MKKGIDPRILGMPQMSRFGHSELAAILRSSQAKAITDPTWVSRLTLDSPAKQKKPASTKKLAKGRSLERFRDHRKVPTQA
jgi:hypothetical protein